MRVISFTSPLTGNTIVGTSNRRFNFVKRCINHIPALVWRGYMSEPSDIYKLYHSWVNTPLRWTTDLGYYIPSLGVWCSKKEYYQLYVSVGRGQFAWLKLPTSISLILKKLLPKLKNR